MYTWPAWVRQGYTIFFVWVRVGQGKERHYASIMIYGLT